MTRNKMAVLGLAALALLAMSAFVASAAQGSGEDPEVTCLEADHVTHQGCYLHGEQVKNHRNESSVHSFVAGLATLTCSKATFEVTTSETGTIKTPTAHPTYESCVANPGSTTAHVNMNGCAYQFHLGKTSGETTHEDEYKGTATLECPAEKSVTISITNSGGSQKCHIELHAQGGIGPVYFRNMTTADPTDGTVEAIEAPADATFSGGFFNCGVTNGTHTTKYSGNVTLEAFDHDENPIDAHID